MAILTKGVTVSTGDQVTAASLNNNVDNATFNTPVDNTTLQVNGSGVLQVKDAGVTASKLGTGAITESKMGTGAITESKLGTGAVTESKLGTSSVTESKLGTGSVTPTKLSTGAPSWDGSSNLTVAGQLNISGASAGQVRFPAMQNASADANTLDDYEEGTWTPSIGGTATYTGRNGTYTKIGRMVFITCNVTINTIGTGSAYVISGLPFTAASEASLAVSNWSNAASSLVYLVGGVDSGATTISVRGRTSASDTIDISANFFQDSAGIRLSGCYYV